MDVETAKKLPRDGKRQKLLRTELAVLAALRNLDPHMQLMTAATLLEVALHDGDASLASAPTVTDLVNRVGVPQSTMSRLLKVLSGGDAKSRSVPACLLEIKDDPLAHRYKRVILTAAGRRYVRQVVDILDIGLTN